MAADAAGDRCHHMRELDVELGCLERAFGDGLGGVGGLQGLAALVDDLFRDCTGLHEDQTAIELAFGQLRLSARIGKLTVGLGRHRFERARVNDVEQVAGMHDVAVLELDVSNETANAGTDLNLLDRLEAAGELVPVSDGPFDRLCYRHRRRRRSGRLRLRLLVAASERERKQQTDRCAAASRKAAKRTAIEPGCRSWMPRSVSRSHFRGPRMLQQNLACSTLLSST